jgi:hypothetical protein
VESGTRVPGSGRAAGRPARSGVPGIRVQARPGAVVLRGQSGGSEIQAKARSQEAALRARSGEPGIQVKAKSLEALGVGNRSEERGLGLRAWDLRRLIRRSRSSCQ